MNPSPDDMALIVLVILAFAWWGILHYLEHNRHDDDF